MGDDSNTFYFGWGGSSIVEREDNENNEPAKDGKKAITEVLHHVSTPCVTIR